MSARIKGVLAACVVVLAVNSRLDAQEPDWSGRVLTFGRERSAVIATPIIERPYRSLHFYGNTVRRIYFRGRWLPSPADMARGSAALVVRRRTPVTDYINSR